MIQIGLESKIKELADKKNERMNKLNKEYSEIVKKFCQRNQITVTEYISIMNYQISLELAAKMESEINARAQMLLNNKNNMKIIKS